MTEYGDRPIRPLPGKTEYLRTILTVQGMIENEGSAAAVQRRYRDRFSVNWTFHNFLHGSRLLAEHFEDFTHEGQFVDTTRRTAKAALGGIVFGRIVGDRAYRQLLPSEIFSKLPLNKYVVDTGDGDRLKSDDFIEAAFARQRVVKEIAQRGLAMLHEQARETVESWPESTMITPEYHSAFLQGFGVTLFASHEYFSELQRQQVYAAADAASTMESD